MGLFSRKSKVDTGSSKNACVMCGSEDPFACEHVVEIRGDEPAWLPPNWRAQAQGEFTFYCTRCDSYPAMKWPSEGGADAGMQIHLGNAHYVGVMKGASQRIEMVKAASD